MKVKLLVSRAGSAGAQNRGDVIDVSTDEAARMIEAGQAEPMRDSAPERAIAQPKIERAVKGK
jgi:hypothetical protein